MTVSWDDEGIVLAARPHSENSLILSVFTFEHGRHSGYVRAGQSSKRRGLFEPGNRLAVHWQARLSDHLGHFAAEPLEGYSGAILARSSRLLALGAASGLVEAAMPEREPFPRIFAGLLKLVQTLAGETAFEETYLRFELLLLMELGFALDLDRCAITGAVNDLAFVSPRTGRAVAKGAAPDYEDRLLRLPQALRGTGEMDDDDFADGLRLTGHFLQREVFGALNRPLPAGRMRLADWAEERSCGDR